MSKNLQLLAGAALSVAAALPLIASPSSLPSHGAPPGTPATLDTIKALAGDWVELDDSGEPTGNVVSSYKVIAGGSAVAETLFGGTEKEMLTVYFADGAGLALTHYCMLGNQPRYVARQGGDARELLFQCAGGSNLASEDEKHMHEGRLEIVDADHIESRWFMIENGENVYTAEYRMARLK